MNSKLPTFLLTLAMFGLQAQTSKLSAATILWTGAGDGVSWNSSDNWSNDVPPTATDDAVIGGVGTNVTIQITSGVAVLSLQCSASLSCSANLALTQGSSEVTGKFSLGSGDLLTVEGVGTTLMLNGPANIDDPNIYVGSGAFVEFAGLSNYHKSCNGANWTVTGASSTLSLPALTNLDRRCMQSTHHSSHGRRTIAGFEPGHDCGGPLAFLADGANSLISLGSLTNCAGQSGYFVEFVAQNGGTISVPLLPGGPLVGVTISSGGAMTTAQFQTLSALTLSGVSASFNSLTNLGGLAISGVVTQGFPALTDFDGANATVSGGAVVTLPVLTNYNKLCSGPNWSVSGAGSVLDLPALTNMTGPVCGYWTIQATAGGEILASNLAGSHE